MSGDPREAIARRMDRLFVKLALLMLLGIGLFVIDRALPGLTRLGRLLCGSCVLVIVALGMLLTTRDLFSLWRALPGYHDQIRSQRRAAQRARAIAEAERALERARRGRA